jgi:hypothetical protein
VSDDKTSEVPAGAEDVTEGTTPEAPAADLVEPPAADVVAAEPVVTPDPMADHAPVTVRDPEPGPQPLAAEIAPEPTPTVSAAEATWSRPAGSAAPPPVSASPSGEALADRPEVLVGAAFAGGLVAAMILKRLGR